MARRSGATCLRLDAKPVPLCDTSLQTGKNQGSGRLRCELDVLVDQLLNLLEGEEAANLLAVDEEARRALHAKPPPPLSHQFYLIFNLLIRHATVKRGAGQAAVLHNFIQQGVVGRACVPLAAASHELLVGLEINRFGYAAGR